MGFKISIASLILVSFGGLSLAQVERVGGVYKVTKIDRQESGFFLVEFESEAKTGKFDRLILESDHVHFGVREGQSLRLSAEVLKEHGNRTEVAQVLLYLPSDTGPTPVWMLSRNSRSSELNGAKYLEMHAPQSDFQVF